MSAYDIILKKRNGLQLEKSEIDFLIEGYTAGEIADYQMSAWAMAVYFQGLNSKETAYLTSAMADSGNQIDLSDIPGIKVDKHSTGGVGDTTTLVLAPLVSAAGIPVAKMSGRGLGHTGGTIDKLESIPGFKTDLSLTDFKDSVTRIGAAVASQTEKLAPADRKLYALRDVTATVESIPLIASSIMSKKLAGGADGIVLDVKTGNGAFMKDRAKAEQLARILVDTGLEAGKKTIALLTDMSQPLGQAGGNSLEVIEAIETLKGEGPADLRKLVLKLGSLMLQIAGKVDNSQEGIDILEKILASGKALEKFAAILENQGGNQEIIENYSLFPSAKYQLQIASKKTGYIENIFAEKIGRLSVQLGAGREKKGDQIDKAAGLVLEKKVGDRIEVGEILAVLHFNKDSLQEGIEEKLLACFSFSPEKIKPTPLIYDIIE